MNRVDELDVIIRRKKGRVIALIPQLNLYAEAHDVQTAMADLDEKKKTLVADLEELGELDRLELEGPSAGRTAARASGAGLGQFAIKTAIVAGAIAAVIVVSGGYLAGSINNSIQETVSNVRSLKIGGAKFWSRVEETVDRMAAPEAICRKRRSRSSSVTSAPSAQNGGRSWSRFMPPWTCRIVRRLKRLRGIRLKRNKGQRA